MIFNDRENLGYMHSLDREYIDQIGEGVHSAYSGSQNLEWPIAPEPILTTKELGKTITEGRAAGGGTFIESIQAAIKEGASHVELALQPETGEPNIGASLYGPQKRREIRELARANDIQIRSVHTPPTAVGNLSGFNPGRGSFDDAHREILMNEVRKGINFAADTIKGGAVVVHVGEFPRPLSEQAGWVDDQGRPLFKEYAEEPEKAVIHLVDDRTGQIIQSVRKNQEIFRPQWRRTDHDYVDSKGQHVRKGEYIDYLDNKVSIQERVPEFDTSTGRFKVQKLMWNDFVKEAEERNRLEEQKLGRALGADEKLMPEQAFFRAEMESRGSQARGFALNYAQDFEEHRKAVKDLVKVREFYERLEKTTPKEELWKIMREDPKIRRLSSFLTTEMKLPTELIDEEIKSNKDRMEFSKDTAAGYHQELQQIETQINHAVPVAKYAKQKTFDSYAELGMYAMQQTKDRNLPKPLFVAPENIFPEMGYGNHPEELIEIVKESRKVMADKLTREWGFSKDAAKDAANDHIKATFDTEHLGLWKKHFQKKPNETEKQFNSRFNSWYMEQVEKLHESGVIGHMHIADGFGFGHGNLPVGHGDLPVVDAVTYLKKKGYDIAYLSEGYGASQQQLRDAWRAFGTPIYGRVGPVGGGGAGHGGRWNDVQHSYFGQDRPPNYVFGAYSPSNDWTLWTQIPME